MRLPKNNHGLHVVTNHEVQNVIHEVRASVSSWKFVVSIFVIKNSNPDWWLVRIYCLCSSILDFQVGGLYFQLTFILSRKYFSVALFLSPYYNNCATSHQLTFSVCVSPSMIFTAHTRSGREGNVFSLSVHRGGESLYQCPRGTHTGPGTGKGAPPAPHWPGTRHVTRQGGTPTDLAPDMALDRGYPPPEQREWYSVGGKPLAVPLEVFLVGSESCRN